MKKQSKKIYGKELILDLIDCHPKIIRSRKKILEYSEKLCDLIQVKKYGKPLIERFALDNPSAAGYSLVQLIETSSITGHFSELWNRAFINIFSCRLFNDKVAADFSKKFFQAKRIKSRVLIR